jgi:hypothetical protein
MKKWAVAFALAAVGASGLVVADAGAASAATYDGQAPASTSCWNDRRIESSTYLYSGSYQSDAIIDLYYSPSCRTTWARIEHGTIAQPGDNIGGIAQIIRNSDGRTYSCNVTSTSGTCYTAMVNDANVTSYAYGVEDGGAFYATGRTANW